MTSQQIGNINEAVLVLRHFINLSARLLPFLEELQQKQHPTVKEMVDRSRIIDVYQNYRFDTRTSEMLLDSNVLELIKESFENISSQTNLYRSRGRTNRKLRSFLQEHRRLREKWDLIDAN